NRLLSRVAEAGLSPEQVQALWINEAVPQPAASFPKHAQDLQGYLSSIVRTAGKMFPNARLCFLSSRIYAGYATTSLNPEPYAYESAFAVKWLLQDQINGVPELNHDPRRGPVAAPWLSWGPYLWADGLSARTDGLVWECVDFAADGTHPSPEGSAKVGALLLDFFRNDSATSSWYRAPAPTGVDATPAAAAWSVQPARPNPFTDALSVPVRLPGAAAVQAAVYSADGRRLRMLTDRNLSAGTHVVSWDGRDDAGRAVAPGVYFVRITAGDRSRTAKVTRVR
ncbi:MAG TPA: FlgD immunoglobulin-like domain containing protein, partial [bacterium]|nr:FlgD immunoglobulin-like domain containing protein [bacterium]